MIAKSSLGKKIISKQAMQALDTPQIRLKTRSSVALPTNCISSLTKPEKSTKNNEFSIARIKPINQSLRPVKSSQKVSSRIEDIKKIHVKSQSIHLRKDANPKSIMRLYDTDNTYAVNEKKDGPTDLKDVPIKSLDTMQAPLFYESTPINIQI